MLITVHGSALQGIQAVPIRIEVNWMLTGKSSSIVGLPDSAVRESMERIESAYKTNGYRFPRTKLLINMAPADQRKSGTAFDLPIALGILGASGQLAHCEALSDYVIMGELSLDGSLRPVKGALPFAYRAKQDHFKGIILPYENLEEAALLEDFMVLGARHLNELVNFFSGNESSLVKSEKIGWSVEINRNPEQQGCFSEVKGQEQAKRALEIAAAGGHHTILIGAPGAGKTMLAKRLPGILPLLTLEEALETTQVYSASGKTWQKTNLIKTRPFRNPHHSISDTGLIGGGSYPQPGEISLAHHGVLFLDELPEFKRNVLEALRQPLEERKIIIARTGQAFEYPAAFMLVAAMNPCPCGFYNHPHKECQCAPGMVHRYMQRISGPLLDRIDLQLEIKPLPVEELSSSGRQETSAVIRERVERARRKQMERLKGSGLFANAQLEGPLLQEHCPLNKNAQQLLEKAMNKLNLSARAYDKLLKIARTIADLAGLEPIQVEHLAEAIQYRSLDREHWGR
jgi:magnesium chelatase family protein